MTAAAKPSLTSGESCAHEHVRENPITLEKAETHGRFMRQYGMCKDCGFAVVRRSAIVTFGPWGVRTALNP